MKYNNKIKIKQLLLLFLFVACGGALFAAIFRRYGEANSMLVDCDVDNSLVTNRALSIKPTTKANILIVTFDDLTASAIPPYVNSAHPMFNPDLNPAYSQFLKTATAFVGVTPIPICLPSRDSILTGRSPDRLKIHNFERYIYQAAPNISTVFKYFKDEMGYIAWEAGKVFHTIPEDVKRDVEYYTEQLSLPQVSTNQGNTECKNEAYCTSKKNTLADITSVNAFDKFLKSMSEQPEENFIAGVGLHRPHLKNAVPASFANSVAGDLPDYTTPVIPGVDNFFESLSYLEDTTDANSHFKIQFNSGSWQSILQGTRTNVWDLYQSQYNTTVQAQRAGYYAATRFSLDNFGKILAILTKYGYENNTHIVMMADHGFKSGEYRGLGKGTLRETDTNVPFIIHSSGQTKSYFNPNPVSTRSLFATLIELVCGPQAVQDFDDGSGLPLDSVSLVPALNNPSYQVPELVFSQYPRCQPLGTVHNNDCATYSGHNTCDRAPISFMGYVAVNRTYRYTEWREYNEYQTQCTWPTWPGQPAVLNQIGYRWMQIDQQQTGTNWSAAPIQQELYQVVDGVVNKTNLAVNPSKTAQAIINQFSNQLKARLQSFSPTVNPTTKRSLRIAL